MKEKLKAFAASLGIDEIGIAPVRIYEEIADKLSSNTPFCSRYTLEDKINPFLIMEDAKSIIVYLIPYHFLDITPSNLSKYSWVRDYHEVAKEISDKINCFLADTISDYKGKSYCDITPIPQKYLAYLAGLGFFGDNHLLINDKYGSWFFIAHIITNYPFLSDVPLNKTCMHCGKCISACPSDILGKNEADFNQCISMVTQKKSPLSLEEEKCFKDSIWGCDICQSICPHNENVSLSPLAEYFGDPIAYLDASNIGLLDRPFSYKKPAFMLRNLALFEKPYQHGGSD